MHFHFVLESALLNANAHYRPVASLMHSHMSEKRDFAISNSSKTHHYMLTPAGFARPLVRNESTNSFPSTVISFSAQFRAGSAVYQNFHLF